MPNLSDGAEAYLEGLGASPEALFYHALATLHAPTYRTENAGALRQDWPRVPLPESREALEASAELGRSVAELLDVEEEAPGVTTGTVREELRAIAVPSHVEEGEQLDPSGEHFEVTAGWGYVGHHGATMPGGGEKTGRSFTPDEEAALPDGAQERFGATTYDVFLGEVAYWRNVPARVWDYTLGGYPVLKKWLSYRERDVLGRGLKLEEVKHFMRMARRIAALLLLEPALDENYVRSKAEEALA